MPLTSQTKLAIERQLNSAVSLVNYSAADLRWFRRPVGGAK